MLFRTITLISISLPLAFGASITALAVPEGSCVMGSIGGCVAQSAYVTGDGAGGSIYTVDFNGDSAIDPNGIATYSGNVTLDRGSPPDGDGSDFLGLNANSPTDPGSVVIDFNQPIDYFGLYWGSLGNGEPGQALDEITINNVVDGIVTQLAHFDGTDLPLLGGGYASFNSANYVSFNASGVTFNEVILTEAYGQTPFGGGSDGTFESDNDSYVLATGTSSTPEPRSLAMALGGIGLIFFIRRLAPQPQRF